MSEQMLDCKGLACPHPVLRCKELLESGVPEALTVLVDNEASKENVLRFLSSRGFETSFTSENNVWTLKAKKTRDVAPDAEEPEYVDCPVPDEKAGPEKIIVFITAERIGSGDDALGAKLMLSYLDTLKEMGSDLWQVVLVNGAVRLTAEGQASVDKLSALVEQGSNVLACGVCLEHFNLLQTKAVGETTNMLDIVTAMKLADKIITI